MSKKRGSNKSYIRRLRDRDLFDVYTTIIRKYGKYAKALPKIKLIREAVETPPKQFYITKYTAELIINRKLKEKLPLLIDNRDNDLFDSYMKVIRKHGKYAKVMPKSQLVEEAIENPPKQFYITDYTATVIINRQLNNKKSND